MAYLLCKCCQKTASLVGARLHGVCFGRMLEIAFVKCCGSASFIILKLHSIFWLSDLISLLVKIRIALVAGKSLKYMYIC